MNSPLWLNTLSTGAEVAGLQKIFEYFEISFLLAKDLSLKAKDMSSRTPTLAIDSFYQQ